VRDARAFSFLLSVVKIQEVQTFMRAQRTFFY